MKDRFKIGNVGISITDLDNAVNIICGNAEKEETAYVCVSNVRAVYLANHDENLRRVLNNSLLTVADGKPIEWYAHLAGYMDVGKTSGHDLFRGICKISVEKGYTNFFFGSTPAVIKKLERNVRREFPNLKIVGAISPPFGSARQLATSEIIESINQASPTFVWVGLGAPKQEIFIDLIVKHIKSSILIGVGLVFDYQAGTVRRAPLWMQRIGLEGVFRLLQQPERLNNKTLRIVLSIVPKLLDLYVKNLFEKFGKSRIR